MFKPYQVQNVAETSLHNYNTGPIGYIHSLTSTLKDVAPAALEPGHVLKPQ